MSKINKPMVLIVVGIAVFTDMLIYGMIVPILPGYVSQLGVSQTAIGFLFASYALALLVATPIMGVWSDRYGRRTPMMQGLFGLACANLLYCFANGFMMLIMARVLQGISAAITWTAGLALLADVFPDPEERGKSMGIALSGQAIGTLLGPAIGGWLYQWQGYQAPFLFATLLVLIDGFLRYFYVKDTPHTDIQPEISWQKLLSIRPLIIISGVTLLGAIIPSVLEPTLPIYLHRTFNTSPGVIGLLFGIPTIAYALSTPIIGILSVAWGRTKVMMFGLLISGVAVALLTLGHSITLIVMALVPLGIGLGLLLAPALSEMAEIADKHDLSYGVVYSIYNTVYSVGMFVGPALGGVLAELFGLQVALTIIGSVSVFYLLVLFVKRGSYFPQQKQS